MSQKDRKKDFWPYFIASAIVAIWVIIVLSSVFLPLDNFYSQASRQAPFILKVLGLGCFAAIPVIFYKTWTSEWVSTGRATLACAILLVLGTLLFINFSYPYNVG